MSSSFVFSFALTACLLLLQHPMLGKCKQLSLTVQVNYNGPSNPTAISLRGDGAGLSWTSGLWMTRSANVDVWTILLEYSSSTTSSSPVLSFKPLIQDKVWSIGSNFQVDLPARSNGTVSVFPWFYSKAGTYSGTPPPPPFSWFDLENLTTKMALESDWEHFLTTAKQHSRYCGVHATILLRKHSQNDRKCVDHARRAKLVQR